MSIGKYSPTVSSWYANDQQWYKKNGGDNTLLDSSGNVVDYTLYDQDGYNSYGYDQTGKDRAGHSESDYLEDAIQQGWGCIHQHIYLEWRVPVPFCDGVKYNTEHGWYQVI